MAWPRDAYVGQKVVCVHNNYAFCMGKGPQTELEPGKIYEIGAIAFDDRYRHGSAGIKFCVGIMSISGGRHWFGSRFFRPVEPRKTNRSTETGMSILKGILNTAPEHETAGGE